MSIILYCDRVLLDEGSIESATLYIDEEGILTDIVRGPRAVQDCRVRFPLWKHDCFSLDLWEALWES